MLQLPRRRTSVLSLPLGQGCRKTCSSPVCLNCKCKGHGGEACTSKGGGKHVPKGKGKGAQPNFFGGKGGKGKGKGKGYGKSGRISELDDAGWAHVGAAPEWNWASGSEWAAVEATQQWPPVAPQWPPASAEVAAPPWMAPTQQPSWTPSAQAWPSASSSAAQGAIRSMTGPVGFVSSLASAVSTRNRFMPLDDYYYYYYYH